MKTEKEKAKELFEKYENAVYEKLTYTGNGVEAVLLAKECAMILVDEIDLLIQKSTDKENPYSNLSALEYWQEVKEEIELL